MSNRPENFIEKAAEAYEEALDDKSFLDYVNRPTSLTNKEKMISYLQKKLDNVPFRKHVAKTSNQSPNLSKEDIAKYHKEHKEHEDTVAASVFNLYQQKLTVIRDKSLSQNSDKKALKNN